MKELTNKGSIAAFAIAFSLAECSSPPPPPPGLYIKMITAQVVSKDSTTRKESVSKMTDDYFEVSLYSYSDGHYTARRDIEKSGGLEDMRLVWLDVTDSLGEPIKFQTSTTFLNHMSARDYEMVTKSEERYRIDYTFKRKGPVKGQ